MNKGLLIKLAGLIPSKKNSRINTRSGRSFPSKIYQRWHLDATRQIIEQFPHWEDDLKIQRTRLVRVHFFFGTRRRCDLSNKLESVMDLLVDSGILVDDNRDVVRNLHVSGSYRKNRDGALVRILC